MPTLVEIALRVVGIYLFLLLLLRVSGRREFSQLAPMDLLAMLLLSETVSPALTAGRNDVAAGLVAAAVLVALTVIFNVLTSRSARAEALIDGRSVVLVEAGVVDEAVRRKLRISEESLRTTLHEEGLEDMKDVRRAYVEPDGTISIIKRKQQDEQRGEQKKLEKKQT